MFQKQLRTDAEIFKLLQTQFRKIQTFQDVVQIYSVLVYNGVTLFPPTYLKDNVKINLA